MGIRAVVVAIGLVCLIVSSGCVPAGMTLPMAETATREMVVTANPLATAAGAKILKAGGTATDAMIAVQTVLGLVEPQSSGIGGGAFIVYYDARSGRLTTLDAREKAPATASEDRFLDQGRSIGFFNAWQSGLSVGVPGVPKLLEYMHHRYGQLPWQRLFVPARTLALNGFVLTTRTSSQVAGLLARNPSCADAERLFFRDPAAFDYFVQREDCTARPAGTLMRNRAYAQTLNRISKNGAAGFYRGAVAQQIAAAVQGDLNIPGDLSVSDLINYQVVERDPVCITYKMHKVCGMGPPSSGGLAVGQILGIIQSRPDLAGTTPLDVATVHLFSQAGRLAFADRNQYVADSDFVSVPAAGMLDAGYLAERAALLTAMDMGTAPAGVPPSAFDASAPDRAAKLSGTSHISIIDRYGNALAMTSSVESSFGNGVMVGGFMLNNQLTDFSFAYADAAGAVIANRVQPNKRPRSSMAPTIVLDGEGQVALVTGSPGGSRIIGYTAQSIMNVLDYGLDPQQAINVPHYMNRNGRTDLEEPIPGVTMDYDAAALAAALMARGHSQPAVPAEGRSVGIITQTSGLSIIQVTESGPGERVYIGGADQRRDGSVAGR